MRIGRYNIDYVGPRRRRRESSNEARRNGHSSWAELRADGSSNGFSIPNRNTSPEILEPEWPSGPTPFLERIFQHAFLQAVRLWVKRVYTGFVIIATTVFVGVLVWVVHKILEQLG